MPEIINHRYVLVTPIGSGAIGTVYRTNDRLALVSHKQTVALKRMTTPLDTLVFASSGKTDSKSVLLAHTLETLASLRHPRLVSVFDYGFEIMHDNTQHPFVTMAWLENAQPITTVAQNKPFEDKIRLIGQVLQALIYLHRRGVLHRNLKPNNVLCQSGQVFLTDFGLGMSKASLAVDDDNTLTSLSYLAPEIILNNDTYSRTSDLYAVGLLAYEILTNSFPYQRDSVEEFMANLTYLNPTVSESAIKPEVAQWVDALLHKDPTQRYQTALETLQALEQASGITVTQDNDTPLDAFLQASKMVGRDVEVAQLSTVLATTLSGKGSAWLIGGESGIGKTRLMNEIRALALADGAIVLRGQAISESGLPYQVWLNPLRGLSIAVELQDSEASVLKTVVPDLPQLLQKTIPDAPMLDPKSEQTRLFKTLRDIITRFTKTQALVILLEDLHWSGTESIALLNGLRPLVDNQKLLIIGNYRNDATPTLNEQLPQFSLMMLKRLSVRFISELTQQILGQAGELPIVNALLYRETEGNVFFLVEVMRTLAEQVGDLNMIGIKTLPELLFVGGIQDAITRRLERVPDSDHDLLMLAALIGRQLDVPLMKAIAPDTDIERWLLRCSEVAVLEVWDDTWTFGHDRLREGAIARIQPENHPALHTKIAQAIEQIYPTHATQQGALAYHWGKANQPEKERVYALQAGESAVKSFANDTALHFLTRADALTSDAQEKARIATLLARVHEALQVSHEPEPPTPFDFDALRQTLHAVLARGEYKKAVTYASYMLRQALNQPEKRELSVALGSLGKALFGNKQYDKVERCTQLAIQIAQSLADHLLVVTYSLDLAKLFEHYDIYSEALAKVEAVTPIAHDAQLDLEKRCHILDIRLSVMVGLKDEPEAIQELEHLLTQYTDDATQAHLHLAIWRLDPNRKVSQERATSAFKKLYADTFDAEFGQMYIELTGATLPPAPQLPPVPEAIAREKLDLETLLDQAEATLAHL